MTTCARCEVGEVRPVSQAGRRWNYRTIPDLQLASGIEIPTCSHCGERWINSTRRKALESALEAEFKETVFQKASRAIEALRGMHRQRNVERLLGLSGGYLSKIVGRDRDPSPTLTAALMLLSANAERFEELRELWSTQPAEDTTPSRSVDRISFAVEPKFEAFSLVESKQIREKTLHVPAPSKAA